MCPFVGSVLISSLAKIGENVGSSIEVTYSEDLWEAPGSRKGVGWIGTLDIRGSGRTSDTSDFEGDGEPGGENPIRSSASGSMTVCKPSKAGS